MEFKDRTDGNTVTVDIQGQLDRGGGSATALRDHVRPLMARGHDLVLLNVANVSYVDSELLGAIVQAHVSAIRAGVRLKLLHVTKRFRELLKIAKLDTVIESVDSEEPPT
jgi:anti-anti-sigma factor